MRKAVTNLWSHRCTLLVVAVTAAMSMPVPPELTVDLPLSQIPGVWRATKLALALGPTPAIMLYRELSSAVDELRPVARRHPAEGAGKAYGWLKSESPSLQRKRPSKVDHSAEDGAALIMGSGLSVVPAPCMEVYRRILADPRLKQQRLRDSHAMLSGTPKLDWRAMYRDYKRRLELTLEVAKDHIGKSQLRATDARTVQNMILAGMEP